MEMYRKCDNCDHDVKFVVPDYVKNSWYAEGILDAVQELQNMPAFLSFWISKNAAIEKVMKKFDIGNIK